MKIDLTKQILSTKRENALPTRAYYVPFDEGDIFAFSNHIVDRTSSSRFTSLNGEWKVSAYPTPVVDLSVAPTNKITVPSCLQLHGYDQIQYLNCRYPFPFDPPKVPQENPTFHYRRTFDVANPTDKYYLVFEGVDSYFALYLNGNYVGSGQITHSTNEFDVTNHITKGTNTLDVVVVKWCAGSYLECQDKFRWTGIFRDVYLLNRPKSHITDYKISTDINGENGIVNIENLSDIAIRYEIGRQSGEILPRDSKKIVIKHAKIWSAEHPHLYDLTLHANGEKILHRVGIRTVSIEDGVFKINGKHQKLKGVNRHESNPVTGATVTNADIIKDLKLMRWANVNAIRTSHYPNKPEFYQLCDYFGFYVMDEADVETHGVATSQGGYDYYLWQSYTDKGIWDESVLDRETDLYERDKNCTCVVIWSLGNEAGYGKMFHQGADYLHQMDTRPVHYESIWTGHPDYYTNKVDFVSKMYAPVSFFDEYLADKQEIRPYILCEYTHAMGNSCGDAHDYWKQIDKSDRFAGAFVWEWCDHAVKVGTKFLYGGDFGEVEHDGNFCVDGLVTPDRQIKSSLCEIKAIYGGKREESATIAPCSLQEVDFSTKIPYQMDNNAKLNSIGNLVFTKPFSINIFRAYIDNDREVKNQWEKFIGYKQVLDQVETTEHSTIYSGRLVKNCLQPILHYTITITPFANGIDLQFDYTVADYIDYLPRIGLEFAIDKGYQSFSYYGYGPYESYIDKHIASDFGEYYTTAQYNFTDYLMPQETGSHFGSTKLTINDVMTITATQPFSFSVLPYSTTELENAKHNFELKKSNATYINLDIAMSGVGSNSCGPMLDKKYRAPKCGSNKFRIVKHQ